MANANKPSYSRASEYVKNEIGDDLSGIAGVDMLLHEYSIERERPGPGGAKTLLVMELSTVDDPENKQTFHAWSEFLAAKIEQIPAEKLPVIVAFDRTPTNSGQKVWTVK